MLRISMRLCSPRRRARSDAPYPSLVRAAAEKKRCQAAVLHTFGTILRPAPFTNATQLRGRSAKTRETILPLRRGEGRGEGNCAFKGRRSQQFMSSEERSPVTPPFSREPGDKTR